MSHELNPAVPPLPEGEKKPVAEKPVAAAAAKPGANSAGPVPMPWTSPLAEKYRNRYGSGVEALTYLGQNYLVVDRSLIPDILRLLRDEERFDYCVDITAVHYPKREKQFDVIWNLYSDVYKRQSSNNGTAFISVSRSVPSSNRTVSGRAPTGSPLDAACCMGSKSTGISIPSWVSIKLSRSSGDALLEKFLPAGTRI